MFVIEKKKWNMLGVPVCVDFDIKSNKSLNKTWFYIHVFNFLHANSYKHAILLQVCASCIALTERCIQL